MVDGKNSQLKFIIGKDICNLPHADRLSKYDCIPWNPETEMSKFHLEKCFIFNICVLRILLLNIIVPDETTEFQTLTGALSYSAPYTGVNFRIKHEIVIRKLGIVSEILRKNPTKAIRVTLTEAGSRFKLASVSFVYDDDNESGKFRNKSNFEVVILFNFNFICIR